MDTRNVPHGVANTRLTVDPLKKHGFAPVFKETPGGHTWPNWRSYLTEFVPQLFQAAREAARPRRSHHRNMLRAK